MSTTGDREFFDAFLQHAAVCVKANEELVALFADLSKAS